MKIYPNKSILTVTKEVNRATDIPLSYIDTNAISYNINTVIDENYKIKEKKEILPYDHIPNGSICLFDKRENQIDADILLQNFQREGKEYMYVPYGSQNFNPQVFKYNVIAKKTMKYSSNMAYNINLLIANNPLLSNRVMPICGDAPSRLIAPANVLINNGDLSLASITEGNMKTSDFTMMLFKNSNTIYEFNPFTNEYEEVPFNKESLLDTLSINIIAVHKEDTATEDWEEEIEMHATKASEINKVEMKMSKEAIDYKIESPIVYNNITFNSRIYFTVPNNTSTIKYHNIFNIKKQAPILIEEHIGKGFVIYIPEGIIDKAINNSNLIYEALLKVFFNSYQKTNTIEEWITDKVPDYIVSNKKLVKKDKFISNVELHKMFGLGADEIMPHEVSIDSNLYPFVKFTGMSKNYLTFEKNIDGDNMKYSDPIKPEGSMSIYTQKQNVMYFKDFIYSINDSIEDCIKVERDNDSIVVNLKTFKHSSSGIYVKYDPAPITIPLIKIINGKEEQIQNANFYLICLASESASFFSVVNEDEYKKDMGVILATIQIRQSNTDKIIYDMRQRGGGLPLTENDNYECFDIGHVNGRPYRKASTLIITLPKYLESNKDVIMDTIKQYSVAEDYPIIIFKED